ncbi:MAG: hypothetical protein IVW57_09125, partial [Ktedonobacterales bacterium]|nr:hypothetical protein [Ktedonobacterales bacterium]
IRHLWHAAVLDIENDRPIEVRRRAEERPAEAGAETIAAPHLAEALQYRPRGEAG